MNTFGTGCLKSKKDKRTVKYTMSGVPLIKGGTDYEPQDIEHQHKVGICTAISLVQLIERKTGKKYSPDFQYLLQKKLYDKNWIEGSSILSALKVAKRYGFLPLDKFPITEEDRLLPYQEYIQKLKQIDPELYIPFCENPIKGYVSVDVKDPQAMANAIDGSYGIGCRYDCGNTWWTPSWLPQDINPLRKPNPATSGHAVIMNKFDYSEVTKQTIANTWGTGWCKKGCADVIWSMYAPTEAWSILDFNPMYQFKNTLKFGMKNEEVKELQKRLQVYPQSGWFGPLTLRAVKRYQAQNGLVVDGIVGKHTIAKLNA